MNLHGFTVVKTFVNILIVLGLFSYSTFTVSDFEHRIHTQNKPITSRPEATQQLWLYSLSKAREANICF